MAPHWNAIFTGQLTQSLGLGVRSKEFFVVKKDCAIKGAISDKHHL
jgi:hypothetical protein